jgi:hypothetical protein
MVTIGMSRKALLPPAIRVLSSSYSATERLKAWSGTSGST